MFELMPNQTTKYTTDLWLKHLADSGQLHLKSIFRFPSFRWRVPRLSGTYCRPAISPYKSPVPTFCKRQQWVYGGFYTVVSLCCDYIEIMCLKIFVDILWSYISLGYIYTVHTSLCVSQCVCVNKAVSCDQVMIEVTHTVYSEISWVVL